MNLRAIALVARRELGSFFGSPTGYVVVIVFLGSTGWLFFSSFFLQGRGDLRSFFSVLPLTTALVAPAVTMRQLSEELSTGTYEIVLTLPLTAVDILGGKFLAALVFFLAMLLPTVSYPVSVSTISALDWGPVIGGYVGAMLLAGLYCSVGLLASSASQNQIVSFIIGLAGCAFLALVDKALFVVPGVLAGWLQFLGADFHFQNFARGVIDSRDVTYFISFSFFALFAAYTVMELRRG